MELKHHKEQSCQNNRHLLIVPYGIETGIGVTSVYNKRTFNRTLWNWNRTKSSRSHPIKSFNRTLWNWNTLSISGIGKEVALLIVPYGIETLWHTKVKTSRLTFNRTLWNWNKYLPNKKNDYNPPFNRTLWNWNEHIVALVLLPVALLIVPYGIETYVPGASFEVSAAFNRTLWNWNVWGVARQAPSADF